MSTLTNKTCRIRPPVEDILSKVHGVIFSQLVSYKN